MTEQQKHFPEFYVTAPQPCPYLAGRLERKLFTHLTHDKPPALIDNLLKGGFRRSQNIAYMPYCEGCQACVSVRVVVSEFEPTRSLRRTLETNGDLVARRLQATPIRTVLAVSRLHRRAPRRRRHGRHDRARLRHDGGRQHHRYFCDGVSSKAQSVDAIPWRQAAAVAGRSLVRPPLRRHLDGLQLLRAGSLSTWARHLHDPGAHCLRAPSRSALSLSRLLDPGLAQDELQETLPATGTAHGQRLAARVIGSILSGFTPR